ncbi:hypothetical protein Raf01_98310 [Rugosimonospora africana]|uniref:Uncharacterized protein n=1 Tax=Rugosimonospora africana TaxID=556532 RepID=A0A8J3R4J4_9ACTN|nr:hypothetical protein Raf01_98310 [Rugosimonospora africana]
MQALRGAPAVANAGAGAASPASRVRRRASSHRRWRNPEQSVSYTLNLQLNVEIGAKTYSDLAPD